MTLNTRLYLYKQANLISAMARPVARAFSPGQGIAASARGAIPKPAATMAPGARFARTGAQLPSVRPSVRPAAPALNTQVFVAPKKSFGDNIAATAREARATIAGAKDATRSGVPLRYHPRIHGNSPERFAYTQAHANTRFAMKNPGFAITNAGMAAQRAFHSPLGQLATNIAMPG